MPVFVVDNKGVPLLPTSNVRARVLLDRGKAVVYSVVPFTIRLNSVMETPVGEFKVGIDDGAKYAGVAVSHGKDVVFCGNIRLRQDVTRKMLQRSQYRRNRRSRKTRHRKARFLNRSRAGWIPPTIKQKKNSILRVVDDLQKRLNITECVVEQGMFDTSSLSLGRKLSGGEYQSEEFIGRNWRQKVFWRDGYSCQNCGSTDNLQAHHIVPKSKGGTNAINNGITLCKSCHDELHKGKWCLTKKPKIFKYPAYVQQGKRYLYRELCDRFSSVSICFGWMTAYNRQMLGLNKDHYIDAAAMLLANNFIGKSYLIIPRRSKVDENHPTRSCFTRNGFRHWDIIKAMHRVKGKVIGAIKSLCKADIVLRTYFDDSFHVRYAKASLLWRPKGIVYCGL